jgi:hypothetical protein
MPAERSRKEESHDTLCEELLKERAAVLSRAGFALEDALDELAKLDNEISIKKMRLQSLSGPGHDRENRKQRRELIDEINLIIEQFNNVHKKAQLKYYYLIVTREALGLRRHDIIQEIYIIPGKKKKIKAS